DLLLLAGFGGLLLLFVFVFAVVHQLDHGRLVVGRDFDEIETFFLRDGAGFVGADFSVFVAVVSDQKDGAGENFLIDARAVLRSGGGGLRLKTSRYYDSLLLAAVRTHSAELSPALRIAVRIWLRRSLLVVGARQWLSREPEAPQGAQVLGQNRTAYGFGKP